MSGRADSGLRDQHDVRCTRFSTGPRIIPPRSNRIEPRPYDRRAYRTRNLIERFFNRIEHFRRIATRYDKLAPTSTAFVRAVCPVISYRYM